MPYSLGCPAWSISGWRGNFLPNGTPQSAFLEAYSKVFNTVEGNSFFYALPKVEVVERWAAESAQGFEFCMKVPREISHARSLEKNHGIFEALIERLSILQEAERLGPTFLQLHESFGPQRLNELAGFIKAWPNSMPLAVEVRNRGFFNASAEETELNQLLSASGVDRVVFDSRALFHAPPSDPAEEKSQGRKPKLPVRLERMGNRPFIRFVGRNDIERVDPWQTEVAAVVAKWIGEGKHPYVFMHTPDDTFAPELCQRFHTKLAQFVTELPELCMPQVESQMDLF